MSPPLVLIENFITNADTLFEQLRVEVSWDERMKARKTASFGVSYNYSGIAYPQTAMLESLLPICTQIDQQLGFLPNNCLLNYYLNGHSSMGYHSDSSKELLAGTGVAIISLGAERQINYKSKTHPEQIVSYTLPSGMLLYMNDMVQQEWLHAIPKQAGVGERISLTFRHIIK
ncbi:MAG: alpha-ketoglutarate-dependent dioxygenase AlkB [Thiolinea sp.]